ncbi:MAG TPA: ribosome biogenesis GTP-binding protein YihA/YsxC [Burkholderiales bacterium]|nr:ribosome biogenesis GTP-binding protein YihA/YsxC [Burkholderiales bacterium]
MATPLLSRARFLLSAATARDLPPDSTPEIAFAGRSNVGKSSAINALAGRKRLAFASKTPGRTQTVNFYDLDGAGRLADLPGYGFAAAPFSLRSTWDVLVGGYLASRASLAGIVWLMDARRPLTPVDRNFLSWLAPRRSPRLALLAKADKLTRAERSRTLAATRRALAATAFSGSVAMFSASSGEGVEETRALLEAWLRERAEACPGARE